MNLIDQRCYDAVYIRWRPFVEYETLANGTNTNFNGINYNIAKEVAKKFGICLNFKLSSHYTWGGKQPNGSFTGVLGMLQREEADVFISPSTMTSDRMKALDFSAVSVFEYHSAMYDYPKTQLDLFALFTPFAIETWLLILCTFFILIAAFVALIKTSRYFEIGLYINKKNTTDSIFKSFSWTLLGLTGQALPRYKMGTSDTLLLGIWVLLGYCLAAVYKSNLIAMLSVQKLQVPFSSLEDLVSNTKYKVIVNDGSFIMQSLKNSEEGTLMSSLNQKTSVVVLQTIKTPEMAVTGHDAYVNLDSAMQSIVNAEYQRLGYCRLTVMHEKFFPVPMAFTFPKNSSLKLKFDFVVNSLIEGGISQHEYETILSNSGRCQTSSQANFNKMRSLSITDFAGVFMLYLSGLSFASAVFCLEIIVAKWKKTFGNATSAIEQFVFLSSK